MDFFKQFFFCSSCRHWFQHIEVMFEALAHNFFVTGHFILYCTVFVHIHVNISIWLIWMLLNVCVQATYIYALAYGLSKQKLFIVLRMKTTDSMEYLSICLIKAAAKRATNALFRLSSIDKLLVIYKSNIAMLAKCGATVTGYRSPAS